MNSLKRLYTSCISTFGLYLQRNTYMVMRLQQIKKCKYLLSSRGIAIVEAVLTIGIIVPVIIACIDLARIGYIKTTVTASLTEALKLAESNRNLQYNVWSNSDTHPQFSQFVQTRNDVFIRSTDWYKKFLMTGVKIIPVYHFDKTSNSRSNPYYAATVAYLPPGYSAHVPGWSNFNSMPECTLNSSSCTAVHNPYRCSIANNQNGFSSAAQSFHSACTDDASKNASRPVQSADTLVNLSKIYPTIMSMYLEVNTLIFGKKRINVQVAGFPRIDMPFTPPTPTATPDPFANCPKSPADPAIYTNSLCVPKEDNGLTRNISKVFPDVLSYIGPVTGENLIKIEEYFKSNIDYNGNYFSGFTGNLVFTERDICYDTTSKELGIDGNWDCNDRRLRAENLPPDAANCVVAYCSRTGVTGCFTPKTKILLGNGEEREIQHLTYKDTILNPITGQEIKIKYLVRGQEKKPIYRIYTNTGVLEVTATHPMIIEGDSIIKAENLKVGDKVLTTSGSYQSVISIEQPPLDTEQIVYNIEVDTDSMNPLLRAIAADGIVTSDFKIQENL
jgi:hypothetical protein